jgi:hypothetical protein
VTHDPTGPALTDGAELLDRLQAVLARYVVLPSPETADAVVLWIAATHAQPSWACAARLVIRAPEKRCGKSRLLDIVEGCCWHPLITVNASPAAVYRSIGTDDPPTILLDEADTIFGPAAQGANEDLRGLLNAGHQRNRPTLRYDAARQEIESIPTFAMAALAGIGVMPDTIEDRAVVVRMRRRAKGEKVAPYRGKRDGPALRVLAAELNTWLRAHSDELERATPDMPVEDRASDTWEPLIAVADLAGGPWPAKARHACTVLTTDHETSTDVPARVRILIDCRTAFGDAPVLPTVVLLDRLTADLEAPWATYGTRGDGLNAMKLSNLLREYDIRSANTRFPDGTQAKAYLRTDFADAWLRYCPDTEPTEGTPLQNPSQSSQPSHRRSERDGLTLWDGLSRTNPTHLPRTGDGPWDGSTRPTTPTRPSLTCTGTTGTTGTGSADTATCITCRQPLTYDDGTHTHPGCDTEATA